MDINKAGFLTNRSLCDATAISTILTSDQGSTQTANTPYQATGCASLSFTPTLSVSASPAASDTAAAMSLAVNLPPSGQAQVKDVTVRLPQGVEVNPGAGDGLAGCSAAQFNAGSSLPAGCPAASQIGTATVTSPLIGTLTGSVFFGDPPAGKLMRMFVVAQAGAGDGVRIKLVGDVDVDPSTGQITTTFSNLPQTPFSQFKLDLAGRRAGGAQHPAVLRHVRRQQQPHAVRRWRRRGAEREPRSERGLPRPRPVPARHRAVEQPDAGRRGHRTDHRHRAPRRRRAPLTRRRVAARRPPRPPGRDPALQPRRGPHR
ncbi:hypothetical protein LRS13_09855 [Svornostia abyssi]|uniref:Uncharacterized protein n=1 Tax=Svornostia abyssi TaxID=2898438 RepID=A0ABY5PMP2_9ACTN|nr:hypothetical protein LRS13_09855 [Parviterribacteraceae bacterium J379]